MLRKHAQAVFYLILAIPALLLGGLLIVSLRDLYELHRIDPAAMLQDFRDAVPRRQPLSFPLPDELYERDPSRKTVFAFGASSLLLSDGDLAFPEYLERRAPSLRVVNFGVSGIDSLAVRQRVREALAVDRPDIIVLYFGHNDYNVHYHLYIIPKYLQKFDGLLRLPYLFYNAERPVAHFADGAFYSYARLHRPQLYQAFQNLGLFRLDPEAFAPINDLILKTFKENTEAILGMAASQKVPVVLITPVGNLHAEPYGDIRTTTAYYRKGMGSADYAESLSYLKQARDAEITTYDLRAKSPLIDYLRTVRRPNVYVLDLEKRLEEMRFGFGSEDFVDYFHFNDRSHRLIAGIIYDFLKEKRLVKN